MYALFGVCYAMFGSAVVVVSMLDAGLGSCVRVVLSLFQAFKFSKQHKDRY